MRRIAKRLPGCKHVKVIYRRRAEEIPARPIELEGAIKEGIEFIYQTQQESISRQGDQLLLHGSVVSRLMQSLAGGLPCCVTVTHLDGMVLARSAFHSSMNYRSLMVFGTAQEVTSPEAKARGLDALVNHLVEEGELDAAELDALRARIRELEQRERSRKEDR